MERYNTFSALFPLLENTNFVRFITAFRRLQVDKARALIDTMTSRGVQIDAETNNTILRSLSLCKAYEDADKVCVVVAVSADSFPICVLDVHAYAAHGEAHHAVFSMLLSL